MTRIPIMLCLNAKFVSKKHEQVIQIWGVDRADDAAITIKEAHGRGEHITASDVLSRAHRLTPYRGRRFGWPRRCFWDTGQASRILSLTQKPIATPRPRAMEAA